MQPERRMAVAASGEDATHLMGHGGGMEQRDGMAFDGRQGVMTGWTCACLILRCGLTPSYPALLYFTLPPNPLCFALLRGSL
ncbi:hypothetical protein BDA96_02G062200 [Sorghum bicolor]|uniref:Uncharacterized protein n=2 Tax=Sorghum bicolor TaxID=4558 RepID=A0A921RLJ3_SORBI|nr:hypothetical protein BDA96_02G062200 [Sorghum bicolor]OQU88606.1 hypothetical protein SORBI_3002G061666 [Sorghum bicolor]